MDEPAPRDIDPPESRRCAICGEQHASYGFGPPGSPVQQTQVWYRAMRREQDDHRWSAVQAAWRASGTRLHFCE